MIFCISGKTQIREKIPATIIVLEWSSADTGAGLSIPDNHHEWSPTWAVFPVAANNKPVSGRKLDFSCNRSICFNSHELKCRRNHNIVNIVI